MCASPIDVFIQNHCDMVVQQLKMILNKDLTPKDF